MTAIQQNPVLLPAAADRAAGVRLKVKDKRPSINNRSEQSIYPTQQSVLRTEATPHVALTVLSLLLQRVAERACADTWRNIRDDLRRIKLAQLLSPNGTVWQLTEPTSDALKHLKSPQIHKPPPILHLD